MYRADTVIPGEGNPQSYNRYSYTGYSPIRYSDPTGHGLFDTIVNFAAGVITEAAKNFWSFIPQAQEDLSASSSEPTAMLIGRAVTDIAGVITGVETVIYGGGLMAGGGAACVLTLGAACAISAEALVAGAAAVTVGITTAAVSVAGAVDTGVALVENISGASSSSGSIIDFNYEVKKLQHLFGKTRKRFWLDWKLE